LSNIVIEVENLSKKYRLGTISSTTLMRDLSSKWAKYFGTADPNSLVVPEKVNLKNKSDEIFALKNINLKVMHGEILGVVGKNGAGKSSLLKVLSRITSPTVGQIKIKGRIASLLEVGTGFHPELTGRENIFLNGAILGMRKTEILDNINKIIQFSEIQNYIDTPVKRYSSGMRVRLAFSVAAHLDADILLMDEVLAVGDNSFQNKCLGKMNNMSESGRTVIFVSHNMGAIQQLCTRAILMEKGQIIFDNIPSKTISHYLNQVASHSLPFYSFPLNDDLPGQIISSKINDSKGNESSSISFHKDFQIIIDLVLREKSENYHTIINIKDVYGNLILVTSDKDLDDSPIKKFIGKCRYIIPMPQKFFMPGQYFVRAELIKRNNGILTAGQTLSDNENNLLKFEIIDKESKRAKEDRYSNSIVALELPWETHLKRTNEN
tara:strand:- start:13175 stop:14482 length:1308 start_codon:yes stop_codon:yes gene_type:complete